MHLWQFEPNKIQFIPKLPKLQQISQYSTACLENKCNITENSRRSSQKLFEHSLFSDSQLWVWGPEYQNSSEDFSKIYTYLHRFLIYIACPPIMFHCKVDEGEKKFWLGQLSVVCMFSACLCGFSPESRFLLHLKDEHVR